MSDMEIYASEVIGLINAKCEAYRAKYGEEPDILVLNKYDDSIMRVGASYSAELKTAMDSAIQKKRIICTKDLKQKEAIVAKEEI